MSRARKICGQPNCSEFVPCSIHPVEPWAGSTRRENTVSGWEQQERAQRVLYDHDRVCHVCGMGGADQVDHVVPLAEGGADDESNLRPIHSRPCHEDKTREESRRARRRAA